MAYPPELRSRLRALYIHKGIGLEAASDRCNVNFRTAQRWKMIAAQEGDDWEKARSASCLAGEGAEAVSQAVLEGFLRMFQTTMEDLKTGDLKPLEKAEAMSRLADAYTKVTRAIQRTAPELNRLAVASEVIQLLAKFLRTKHPSAAPVLLGVLEAFGEELAAVYG